MAKYEYTLKAKEQVVKALNGLIDYSQLSAQGYTLAQKGSLVKKIVGVSTVYTCLENPTVGELFTSAGSKVVTDKIAGLIVLEGTAGFGRRMIRRICKNGVYVNSKGELIVEHQEFAGSYFKNIMTDEKVETVEGLPFYKVYGGTAAAIRKGAFIAVKEELLPQLVDFQNETYLDAYDMNLKGQLGNRKELANKTGRMAHRSTPQVALGNLKTIGVFTGEFMEGGSDGTEYTNASTLRDMIEKALSEVMGVRVYVAVDKVLGIALQQRPATSKSQGAVKHDGAINQMVKTLIDNGVNVVVRLRKDLDAKSSAELFALENTLVIVTDDENFVVGKSRIDLLTDRNATKLSYNLGKEVPLYMLKAIKSTGKANLNGQVYSKFIHTEKGVAYVQKKVDEAITKFFITFEDVIESGEGFVSEEQLASSDINGITWKLFRKEVLQHFPNLERRVLRDRWKEAAKMLSNLKIEVDGDYLTAEGDPAKMYGAKTDIFAPNEVFINDRKLLEIIREILIIKYPSVHNREFLLGTLVPHDEVEKRIEEKVASGEWTKAAGKVYRTDLFSQSKAKIIVSTDSVLKKLLAGFDMDTDAVMAFYDQELVSIMKETSKPLAVMIEGFKSKDTTMYSLDIENNGQMVINNIEGSGMGIGVITHISEIFSGLLAETKDKAAKFLTAVFAGSTRTQEYTPLRRGKESIFETLYVNETEALRVVEELNTVVAITQDNVHVVIEDLMAIARYVQETEIDFAKTGVATKVNIQLKMKGKDVKSAWHKKLVESDIDNGKVFYELHQSPSKLYSRHVLHDIRIKALEKAQTIIQEKLDAIADKGFSEATQEYFEDFLTKSPYLKLFKSWKNQYNDIQGEYVESIRDVIDEETGDYVKISDDELDFARAVRKQKVQALVNTIRLATQEMTLAERGRAMMAMSITDSEGNVRKDLGTGFYTILPLELFALLNEVAIAANGKAAGAVGSDILVNEKKNSVTESVDGNLVHKKLVDNGTKVTFDEFGNPDIECIVPNADLRGSYIVRKIRGNYIAVKSISQVIKEIAANNVIDMETASFTIAVNFYEDKEEVYSKLKDAAKVIITASKESGDYIRLEDGTPLASIVMPDGDSNLSRALNGKLFEVASVDLRKDGGYQSILVVVKNGILVEGGLTRPTTKYITKAAQEYSNNRRRRTTLINNNTNATNEEELFEALNIEEMFED